MIEELERPIELALDGLRSTKPDNLGKWIAFYAENAEIELPSNPFPVVVEHLRRCGPNDRVLHALTLALHAWDDRIDPRWGKETVRHSAERREAVLTALGFGSEEQLVVNQRILRFSESDLPIVIAEEHEAWYEKRKGDIKEFYWKGYRAQLGPPRGSWSSDDIGMLELSANDVISRLSDPTRSEIYPVKGLVMGYVQSGKTAHFSALIAKAADAGYRMIIVLAGTLDILRKQTQRRLDKEIVGRELLGEEEYGTDLDWEAFVAHGGLPSHLGAFDWERLTNRDDDYRTLSRHLSILEFKSADRAKPFNHADNLRFAVAKLAVLKKVPTRIRKLCSDLSKLKALRSALEHVPTLIIDDESDQASINTVDQTKPGKQGERTSTNKAIVQLLKLLPRAQYVGYTATPFANVFIDPDDAEDLFPKDFIVSLPKPPKYMGVSDFFDFGRAFAERDFTGNQNAFVRPVEGGNEEPKNLPEAIDAFVLAGAVKLYREAKDSKRFRFRHHTMLVHHSATRVVHEADREMATRIFGNGSRYQRTSGIEGLRRLFERDFVPVSHVRAADAPFPNSFRELKPFVAKCISRICDGKPVRIVNGDDRYRDETPDFEQSDVWAILIGGAKLSRGYTVEGLTISYYRRPTGTGDTLMQMGRWFGFRPGYRDLVRLYIGKKELKGKVFVDLYEAFGAVCLDEEALRSDLRKYSREGLRPIQVPPLVRQHMPQLPPTSSKKMFNAEIRSQDFSGEWTEKTSAPTLASQIKKNQELAESLLLKADMGPAQRVNFVDTRGATRDFETFLGRAEGEAILEFLRGYTWADGKHPISLECAFIEKSLASGQLRSWHVLLPQLKKGRTTKLLGVKGREVSVIERSRVSESRFGVYSDPGHVEAASFLARVLDLESPPPTLLRIRRTAMPVIVMYFVQQKGTASSEMSVGFGIQYPGEKKDKAITWMVRDRARANAIVVAAG